MLNPIPPAFQLTPFTCITPFLSPHMHAHLALSVSGYVHVPLSLCNPLPSSPSQLLRLSVPFHAYTRRASFLTSKHGQSYLGSASHEQWACPADHRYQGRQDPSRLRRRRGSACTARRLWWGAGRRVRSAWGGGRGTLALLLLAVLLGAGGVMVDSLILPCKQQPGLVVSGQGRPYHPSKGADRDPSPPLPRCMCMRPFSQCVANHHGRGVLPSGVNTDAQSIHQSAPACQGPRSHLHVVMVDQRLEVVALGLGPAQAHAQRASTTLTLLSKPYVTCQESRTTLLRCTEYSCATSAPL